MEWFKGFLFGVAAVFLFAAVLSEDGRTKCEERLKTACEYKYVAKYGETK